MVVDIYAIEGSPPCRAVFLVDKAIGLNCNIKLISMEKGENKTPEFLKMNPQHTVPTMNDGGVVLGESRAIITYLMNKYAPDSSLYPKDPAARGLVDSRLYFDAGLFASIKGIVVPTLFTKNKAEVDANLPKVLENLQVLEIFLTNSPYVAGKTLTVADLAVLACVSSVEEMGIVDLSTMPHVQAWLAKLKADLSYYSVNAKGAKMIGTAFRNAKKELDSK